MSETGRDLVVLSCSASKVETDQAIPALALYDGPAYRILRSYLRNYRWPAHLSVAVLSAKHGLIGALSPLRNYDQRMNAARAAELSSEVTSGLRKLAPFHRNLELILGRDYLPAVDAESIRDAGTPVNIAPGGIGYKLQHFRDLLHSSVRNQKAACAPLPRLKRPIYFLPDWDDFLDVDFDFQRDRFSSPCRADRNQQHSIALMRPERLCDGVLVSLAQNLGTKGMLRRAAKAEMDTIAPQSVRKWFCLESTQWAFGDCGAFSYVNEERPFITVEQAVAAYDLHEFDLGASVDHIPVAEVFRDGKRVQLTNRERRKRVRLTEDNAEQFLRVHRERGATFIPVGVIQGLAAPEYGHQCLEYLEMGYTHIALGGLVPRTDAEILAIVRAVYQQLKAAQRKAWIHLLGVFRPGLQAEFRALGVDSFDSATYFRKAWLRSDQNYLGTDGSWYAAIRVPPTSDPRTLIRLEKSGLPKPRITALEAAALKTLHDYDAGVTTVDTCLAAVLRYDALLSRSDDRHDDLHDIYLRTLQEKPWKTCTCPMCSALGIDVLIFRGLNRNKRRGAHNTLMLFKHNG